MIKDVFVPSKIKNYYLFAKRVLAFEINAVYVRATLISFSKKSVTLENSMTIFLKDQNSVSVVNAIKKIASQIGSYDEVVTSLTSSALVFKELTLPFVGREKVAMVVSYEVEALLPFTLDEVDIDFIITHEDVSQNSSTVLVAAARKSDVQQHIHYFEKAGIEVAIMTVDMFALYDFYKHAMYIPQSDTSQVLVDFAVDAIRVLYVHQGQLKSLRLIPSGISMLIQKIDTIPEAMKHRLLDMLLQGLVEDEDGNSYEHIVDSIVQEFCKQITLSLSFFEKQVKEFIVPAKILCLGIGVGLYEFQKKAQACLPLPIESFDVEKLLQHNEIDNKLGQEFQAQDCTSLIIPLSAVHFGHVNLLSNYQQKIDQRLLNRQLLALFFVTTISLVGLYFYSNTQMQRLQVAFLRNKKEIVRVLDEQMGIDAKGIKRTSMLVDVARETLQREKKLWFSFSKQSENSFLEYLQDISSKIDRGSLGLDLKVLSMNYEEVIMQGKVKDFEALETFEEELMELSKFNVVEKPRELAFTVKLQVKDTSEKS